MNIELFLFSFAEVAKQFQVRKLNIRRKYLWSNFGLIEEFMDLFRILSCKYANDADFEFQRCL